MVWLRTNLGNLFLLTYRILFLLAQTSILYKGSIFKIYYSAFCKKKKFKSQWSKDSSQQEAHPSKSYLFRYFNSYFQPYYLSSHPQHPRNPSMDMISVYASFHWFLLNKYIFSACYLPLKMWYLKMNKIFQVKAK